MLQIKNKLAKHICERLGDAFSVEQVAALLEYPPDRRMGDLALPCFTFAKALKKAPQVIAEEISRDFLGDVVRSCEAKGGYLNFFVCDAALLDGVLGGILAQGERYGSSEEGSGKTVVIDYSAPNIAKPFHIGHLRSTVIGESLRRLHACRGYTVVGVNHLGDYGTQFGKMIVAYRLWGDDAKIDSDGVDELVNIYVKFHREAENDPTLDDQARAAFAQLEAGAAEETAIWQRFCDISMRELERIYKRLDVSFDYYTGESFYTDKMDAVVDGLKEKGLLKLDQGASIVDLEKRGMPPCLILKSDGTSLYATRDLATAIYRYNTFNFHKSLYVTSYTQNLHFAQVYAVLEEMGYPWAKDLVHIPFGQVSVEGRKMATREGNMLCLDEILGTSVAKVRQIMEEKNPNHPDKEGVSEKVGVGAVIFHDLSNGRIRDIDFNWDEVLNFDGNTGPYVQYTYARTCSLLTRAGESGTATGTYTDPLERELTLTLSLFPERVAQALREYEPSVVSRYLLELCAVFNRFYHDCPIIKAEPQVRSLRLGLVSAVNTTLGKGLNLICMEKTPNI